MNGNGGLQVRQTPRARNGDFHVSDFTTMVRVAGRPAAVRVYTAAELDEAAQYAAAVGGQAMSLPLAPPAGYTVGGNGSLVPVATHGGYNDAIDPEESASTTT